MYLKHGDVHQQIMGNQVTFQWRKIFTTQTVPLNSYDLFLIVLVYRAANKYSSAGHHEQKI